MSRHPNPTIWNRLLHLCLAFVGFFFIVATGSGSSDGGNTPPTPTTPAAPAVSITSPAGTPSYNVGGSLILAANATDYKGNPISTRSVQWYSSEAPSFLGTGKTLSPIPLTRAGSQKITVVASDTDGRVGSAETTITVSPVSAGSPVCAITSPTATDFSITDEILFSGTGDDSSGNPIDSDKLVWSSSLKPGWQETGESIRVQASDLGQGTHTIYFQAEDTNGKFSAPQTVTLRIAYTPPIAKIYNPAAGTPIPEGRIINLKGKAMVGTAELPLNPHQYHWLDDTGELLGYGPIPPLVKLKGVRQHTISLKIFDDQGGTDTDDLVINVTAAP